MATKYDLEQQLTRVASELEIAKSVIASVHHALGVDFIDATTPTPAELITQAKQLAADRLAEITRVTADLSKTVEDREYWRRQTEQKDAQLRAVRADVKDAQTLESAHADLQQSERERQAARADFDRLKELLSLPDAPHLTPAQVVQRFKDLVHDRQTDIERLKAELVKMTERAEYWHKQYEKKEVEAHDNVKDTQLVNDLRTYLKASEQRATAAEDELRKLRGEFAEKHRENTRLSAVSEELAHGHVILNQTVAHKEGLIGDRIRSLIRQFRADIDLAKAGAQTVQADARETQRELTLLQSKQEELQAAHNMLNGTAAKRVAGTLSERITWLIRLSTRELEAAHRETTAIAAISEARAKSLDAANATLGAADGKIQVLKQQLEGLQSPTSASELPAEEPDVTKA